MSKRNSFRPAPCFFRPHSWQLGDIRHSEQCHPRAAIPPKSLFRVQGLLIEAKWIFGVWEKAWDVGIVVWGLLWIYAFFSGARLMRAAGLYYRKNAKRVGWFTCAWCTSNQVFSRRAFLICSLVPLLALDALACVGLATATLTMVGYAILVTNTLGAVADVWGVMYLARFPRDSFVYEARATNVILRRLSG